MRTDLADYFALFLLRGSCVWVSIYAHTEPVYCDTIFYGHTSYMRVTIHRCSVLAVPMAVRCLPDDVWILISEWSANPALAHVDRKRRSLLLGHWIVTRLHQDADIYRLERWIHRTHPRRDAVGVNLSVAPTLLQRLRLPCGFGVTVSTLRLNLVGNLHGLDEELLDELAGHFLAGWVTQGYTNLRNLCITLPMQSLCDEGFASVWNATLGQMASLCAFSLDVSANGMGDDAFGNPGLAPIRSDRLETLHLNFANNEITCEGLQTLCGLLTATPFHCVRDFTLDLGQNAMVPGCAGALARILWHAWGVRRIRLGLTGNRLAGSGVSALVATLMAFFGDHGPPAAWEHLTLDLGRNAVNAEGYAALCRLFGAPDILPRLRTLDVNLAYNCVRTGARTAIAWSPTLEHLALDLTANGLMAADLRCCLHQIASTAIGLHTLHIVATSNEMETFEVLLPLRALTAGLRCLYLDAEWNQSLSNVLAVSPIVSRAVDALARNLGWGGVQYKPGSVHNALVLGMPLITEL